MKGNPRPTKQPAPNIDRRFLPKGNFHTENHQEKFLKKKLKKKG